ncbi:MAG: hypothetical protein M5U16_05195 [Hyphomicrobium sp.]|nr:hypothetical protein [Hyphomicrobium sp.]
MLRSCLLASALLLSVEPATALEVKSCEDANVGLTELIPPVDKNSRTYKDGKISVYALDTVEPVCCAAGVAIVIPDVADEVGGNKCLAVVGFASVQLDEAVIEDDPDKGLLMTIPTRVFSEAADSAPGEPIRLWIDVDAGTLAAE